MNTEITTQETGITPVMHQAESGLSIFDSGAFEKMVSIAKALSQSTLIPETLQGSTQEETAANCLLVVEQSSRWGLSPFAVMQCASVIHGRLMWEGKLVSAVVDAQLGIRLDYKYSGSGDNRKVVVSGRFPGEEEDRTIEGTVGQWKTTKKGSPWEAPKNHDRQLAYRGAREWARRHASAVMLGVITEDESLEDDRRQENPKRFVRAEPIDPAAVVPQIAENKPETTPEQKPELLSRDCEFDGIAFQETTGWIVSVKSGKTAADMAVLDNILVDRLNSLETGTMICAKYSKENGTPQLQDFEIIKEEGELI